MAIAKVSGQARAVCLRYATPMHVSTFSLRLANIRDTVHETKELVSIVSIEL